MDSLNLPQNSLAQLYLGLQYIDIGQFRGRPNQLADGRPDPVKQYFDGAHCSAAQSTINST
jgi:hypothetical protein